MATDQLELSIVMPCLNEAETLAICVDKARSYLERSGVAGEVIVADNGSTDGSQRIAADHGARVIDIPRKGYGSALMGGIEAARGRFVIMGDADDSYDLAHLDLFVEALRAGDKLVMGDRFRGGIAPRAMPPLHRYLGNPVLSWLGRVLFRSRIRDFHCGLRGFDRDAILDLGLRTTGMEFASELVVKSTLAGLRIGEVPTTLKKDGRSRPPHLRSWRDGWRHLRFLLIFSPKWLFLYPGMVALILGVVGSLALLFGPVAVGGVGLDVSSQLYLSALAIVGYQGVVFWFLTKAYGQREGFALPRSRLFSAIAQRISVESSVLVGVIAFVVGLGIAVAQFIAWAASGFGALDTAQTVRLAVPGALLMILGAQTIMAGMFLGILSIDHKS
ncbi:glycosyltransferase family 2 protein [Pseudolysinimonas kribbensis]|uniref:Dolichol-P-glucose synthetase n=1 Tax=Pseudolysinimonas kribbensis TaxID=433641 RepID=A0ABQ6K1Q9_9MICO|nr:glycosyltransferase family 2 protein [Pseudolysinimonas kribbensis]GMA94244.1 dolichol-P-glucose synthetase [Pseudolysinimonas kribbensis]